MRRCIFDHQVREKSIWVDASPYPPNTKILIEYCINCDWKRAWAFPKGQIMSTSVRLAESFFPEETKEENKNNYAEEIKMKNKIRYLFNTILTDISDKLLDYLDKQAMEPKYKVILYFNSEEDADNFINSIWGEVTGIQYYSYNY